MCIHRAIEVYENEGANTLIHKIRKELQKYITHPITDKYIMSNYPKFVADSKEIKQRSSVTYNMKYDLEITENEICDYIPRSNNADLTHDIPFFPSFDTPFVSTIQNAYIVGWNPLPLTPDGKIIADVIYFDPESSLGKNRFQRRIKSGMKDSPLWTFNMLNRQSRLCEPSQIPCASIVHYQSDNFATWMWRELTKLRGIEKYEQETGQDVTLLIPRSPPDFVYEALDIMGRDNYIEWDGGLVSVEKLVVPSYPQPFPTTLNWLKDKLENESVQSPVSEDWIFISRQMAEKGRRISNYQEVINVMKEHGIEPVFLEEMSLQEQIATFQKVEGVIGAHGAGLVGMIWTDNLSIIEICNGVVKGPFFIIANVLNHNYSTFIGESVGNLENDINADIEVNPGDLVQKFKI